MKRKKLWIWIVCLVLLLGCAVAVLLLRQPRQDGAEQTSPTTAPITAAEERTEDPGIPTENPEPLPTDTAPPEETEKQPDASAPADAGTAAGPAGIELPEIEIPTAQPDAGDDIQENTPEPEPDDTQPEWGNSDIVIDENGDILLPEVP